jgi:hypothetical protein
MVSITQKAESSTVGSVALLRKHDAAVSVRKAFPDARRYSRVTEFRVLAQSAEEACRPSCELKLLPHTASLYIVYCRNAQ